MLKEITNNDKENPFLYQFDFTEPPSKQGDSELKIGKIGSHGVYEQRYL